MGAQGAGDDAVRLQRQDGLVQRTGEALDAGGVAQLVEIAAEGLRRRQLPLDPVQPSGEAYRQGQVGVAGGVRAPQLHTGAASPGRGDADQGGAVAGGPGQVAGGLVAGHQPLVAVHQRVGDGAAAPHMPQQPGDELIGQGRQVPGVRLVAEGVLPVPEQGHVHMHPAAGGAADGLGHEGGVEAVLLSQGLHRQLEGHDVVRGPEGIRVLQVDFVLASRHLVVAGLHRQAHLL